MIQDLSRFRMPNGFRGRSILWVQLWWLTQSTLFQLSPQFAYRFRAWLLRCFGAKIGKDVRIRSSVTITYPWKVNIGDYVWVGDNVVLYSLGPINIADHAVVSQRCYLCAGYHDYTVVDFPIRSLKIDICEQVWLATDVFVAPGVTVGKAAVIGARSSVFTNMPPNRICFGNPCKPFRFRILNLDCLQ